MTGIMRIIKSKEWLLACIHAADMLLVSPGAVERLPHLLVLSKAFSAAESNDTVIREYLPLVLQNSLFCFAEGSPRLLRVRDVGITQDFSCSGCQTASSYITFMCW